MRPTPSDAATGIVVVWAVECVAALLLLLERLTGAVESLPSPTAVLLFAVVCLAVNLMAVALFRAPLRKASESRLNGLALLAVTCLPPLVIGLTLLHSDADGQRAALCGCVLLTAVMVSRDFRRTDWQSVRQNAAPVELDAPLRIDATSQGSSENPGMCAAPPPLGMQRRCTENGETIEGEFTATFTAGQKTAVVHLAFIPLLSGIPHVECEPLDDADVRWKLAVAQPYGVRIDVQRSGSIRAPAEARLAWFATTQARSAKAA